MTENKKKKSLVAFVLALFIFAATCIGFMNYRYDSLARYPYTTDEASRKLIKQYLNKEEINYIIQYSIAPNVFVAFIKEDRFNIYHAAQYKELSQIRWEDSVSKIVNMVEDTYSIMDVQTLANYLYSYSYEELKGYLFNQDAYQENTSLVHSPLSTSTYLHEGYSVGKYVPKDLITLSSNQQNEQVQISKQIQIPLEQLCSAIQENLQSTTYCAGLKVANGYISYDEQVKRYQNGIGQKPGQDDHQLGFSVDFRVSGIEDAYFEKTIQSKWLKEHANEYGFVYLDQYPSNHLRFISKKLIEELKSKNTTFDEYGAQLIQ